MIEVGKTLFVSDKHGDVYDIAIGDYGELKPDVKSISKVKFK